MGDADAAPGRRASHGRKALEKLNRLAGEIAPVPAERSRTVEAKNDEYERAENPEVL